MYSMLERAERENRVVCIPPVVPCLNERDAPRLIVRNEAFAHHLQDFKRQVADLCTEAHYDRNVMSDGKPGGGRREEYRELIEWARSRTPTNCSCFEYDIAGVVLDVHERTTRIFKMTPSSKDSTYEETTVAGIRVRIQKYGKLHINGECLDCLDGDLGVGWASLYHKTEEAVFDALRAHASKEHGRKKGAKA